VDIASAVRDPRYLRLLILTALTGIPISLAALAFEVAFETGIQVIWYDLPTAMGMDEPPWWVLLCVPTVGGFLVALARRLPGDGGHNPLLGFAGGVLGPKALASVVLAGLVTLSCGAVLGHEAPLMAIGTGVALFIGAKSAASDSSIAAMFAVAGGAAAVSALFGNPLVAAVLIMEGMNLGTTDRRPLVLPALLSAGVGYLVFTGVGNLSGFTSPNLAVPTNPPGQGITWYDLGWTFVMAPLAALLIMAIRAAATRLDAMQTKARLIWFIPLAGLVVGAAALGYSVVTGDDPRNVLFSGQSQVGPLADTGYETATLALLALLVFKGVAYVASLAGGFRGGPVFPSIFFGALVGTAFGTVLPGVSPLAAFYVSIAAATATNLRIPVGSILLVALVGGVASLQLLPLIIIAAVVGIVIRAWFDGGVRDTSPAPAL